jgi:hypothetical protein
MFGIPCLIVDLVEMDPGRYENHCEYGVEENLRGRRVHVHMEVQVDIIEADMELA